MFNNLSSVPDYLASRRSGKPRDMVAPGPDAATLDKILRLAMRTPDHGKLFPWRFITIDDRSAFAGLMQQAFAASNPDARPAQIEAAVAPAYMAPTLVALLFAPQPSDSIYWRQLSTELVPCLELLSAKKIQ